MIGFLKKQFYRSLFVLIFPVGWLVGYYVFYSQLPMESHVVDKADVIVVLTGGRNRLKEGVLLLQRYKAPHLFVSGVSKNVRVKQLIKGRSPSLYDKITFGYEATTTKENALEFFAWQKTHPVKSVLLVTNDYHMPRSLLEFHHLMPHLKVIPYPVKSRSLRVHPNDPLRAAYTIAGEYTKYLVVHVRQWLETLMASSW